MWTVIARIHYNLLTKVSALNVHKQVSPSKRPTIVPQRWRSRKVSHWCMLGPVAMHNETERTKTLLKRIEQLGDKSTQVLLFLSFAFVAVVAMKSDHAISMGQQHALTIAMRWWAWALLPVLLGILPVRDAVDFSMQKDKWYNLIRWSKVVLLVVAVLLILFGGWYFGCAIWPIG